MAETEKRSSEVRQWISELEAARAREKDWREESRDILEIYCGKKKDSIPFNILYSNTETLQPALYNTTPRPVVQRRFKDEAPLGKAAASAGQRMLEFLLDTNVEEYEAFDDVMGDAVLDALLPGRGAAWVKYDAKISETEGPDGKPLPMVQWETVCFESLKWDRWFFGHAKKWKQVPWIAKEYQVTQGEAEEKFGKELAGRLTYAVQEDSKDQEESRKEEKTDEQRKTATIYEVWDKDGGRVVRFIAPTLQDDYLKVEDDPLGLTGFYPTPRPLRFVRKANDLRVTPMYALYENQAKELNRITVRINKVAEALKVRGAYDSTLGAEIEKILEKEDNALVPAENVAALQEGGLDKAIWLMPIEKLIAVLQQLMVAREQCKQTIYEITGIADILRGSTKASETLGAQEIKTQWAGLRLKRLQKDVQVYVRDLLRIALEIAAKKLSPETFARMTGLPFPSQQAKVAAQQLIALSQRTGQPPPPQAIATAQAPSWEEVLEALRSDTQRSYSIDIETNSTVDVEATEDKAIITEVMTAISQLLNGLAPLVESGTMPFEAAQALLLAVVRRFRFGPEIEDYIKAMRPPQPKQEPKELEAIAKEKQALAADRAKLDVDKMQHAATVNLDKERAGLEAERLQSKLQSLNESAISKVETLVQRQEMKVQGLIEKALMQIGNAKTTLSAAKAGQDGRAQAEQQARATQEVGRMLQSTQATLLAAFKTMQEEHAAQLGEMLKVIAAPKQVVRGPDGRMTHVVPQV